MQHRGSRRSTSETIPWSSPVTELPAVRVPFPRSTTLTQRPVAKNQRPSTRKPYSWQKKRNGRSVWKQRDTLQKSIKASSSLQGMIRSGRKEYQCKLLQANFYVKCSGFEQIEHCTDTFSIRYWPAVTMYHSSPAAPPQPEPPRHSWLLQGHCKLGHKSETIIRILSESRHLARLGFWQENVLELTVTGEKHVHPGNCDQQVATDHFHPQRHRV